MRYLVTGACGFIGSHLCDHLLSAGHEVLALDDLSTGTRENLDPRARLVVGSIAERGVYDALLAGVDGVFHLAAIASVERSRVEWSHTHEVNLSGTVRLFDALTCLPHPMPVVYASSAAVYGNSDALPLTESTPPSPLTAYGADKLGCEQHARVAALVHGVPAFGLRFFNVYGQRQDPSSPYSGVVSIFMRRIPARQPITIYGDGLQSRDFIFVGDVVRALRAAMSRIERGGVTASGVSNVCTGRSTTLLQLIEAIERISGVPAEKSFAPARMGDIKESLGAPALMEALLDVRAETEIEAGLRGILEAG
jgi:UDP-glucose 4-epimerase